jgi:hypothetical protein
MRDKARRSVLKAKILIKILFKTVAPFMLKITKPEKK